MELPKSKEIDIEQCQPGYHPEGFHKRVFKHRETDKVSLVFNYSIIRIGYGNSYIEINIGSEGQLIALITFLKSEPKDQEALLQAIKKGGLQTIMFVVESWSKTDLSAYKRSQEQYSTIVL